MRPLARLSTKRTLNRLEQTHNAKQFFDQIQTLNLTMVDVAQLVELRVVIPAVAGSSPVVHPI